MAITYLVKYGELALKGQNRQRFERRLADDIRSRLRAAGAEQAGIERRWGRMYVHAREDEAAAVAGCLSRTFGIVAFARAVRTEKDPAAIGRAALDLAAEGVAGRRPGQKVRFKVEARRSDKSFPLTSYQIACRLGDALLAGFADLQVDLHHPDWVLNVEIRESAYLYGAEIRCPGGLPLGSGGRGLLLLSGGIDSPVAGYLMGKRGLAVDAVYFDTPPFTSVQARDKVAALAAILSGYLTGLRLYVAPFTDVQLRIKEGAPEAQHTLLVRAAMVRIAERLAGRLGAGCLISGESLGQVASQTVESIRFTGSMTEVPLFRPLIGLDKEEIVALARRIGTFETSTLPYEDCCTIFAPRHPLTRPRLEPLARSFTGLGLEDLLAEAAEAAAPMPPA